MIKVIFMLHMFIYNPEFDTIMHQWGITYETKKQCEEFAFRIMNYYVKTFEGYKPNYFGHVCVEVSEND